MSIRNTVTLLQDAAANVTGRPYQAIGTKQLFQAWAATDLGTVAATVKIQATNDPRALTDPANAAWQTINTITLADAAPQAGSYANNDAWGFFRVDLSGLSQATVTVVVVDAG